MEQFPPLAGPDQPGVWPPPPQRVHDEHAALRALLTKYQSPTQFSYWILGLLGATFVLCIASLIAFSMQTRVTLSFSANLDTLAIILFLFGCLWALIWTRILYKNLSALGITNPRSKPGLVVFSFFIPMLNLIIPALTYCEIWKATSPQDVIDRAQGDWRKTKAAEMIPLWGVVTFFCGFLWFALSSDESKGKIHGPNFEMIVRAAMIIFLGFSYYIAEKLTQRQERRHAELTAIVQQTTT